MKEEKNTLVQEGEKDYSPFIHSLRKIKLTDYFGEGESHGNNDHLMFTTKLFIFLGMSVFYCAIYYTIFKVISPHISGDGNR